MESTGVQKLTMSACSGWTMEVYFMVSICAWASASSTMMEVSVGMILRSL